MMIPKSPRFNSKKLREAARNESCVMCENDEEGKVILAHLPYRNSGTGLKCSDFIGAHLCFDCHDYADSAEGRMAFEWRYLALTRTLERLFQNGTLIVK
jgi:hypothetical protein